MAIPSPTNVITARAVASARAEHDARVPDLDRGHHAKRPRPYRPRALRADRGHPRAQRVARTIRHPPGRSKQRATEIASPTSSRDGGASATDTLSPPSLSLCQVGEAPTELLVERLQVLALSIHGPLKSGLARGGEVDLFDADFRFQPRSQPRRL